MNNNLWLRLSEVEKKYLIIFCRYRDDTQSVICGDDPEVVISVLKKLCTMYPSHIGLTVEVSHWYGSHLDACFLVNEETGKFSTFPRRNIDSPVSFTPASSDTPTVFKWAALESEILRYRRLSSSVAITNSSIKLLRMEFESLGYKGFTFDDFERKFKLKIDRKYGNDGWPMLENEFAEDDCEVAKKYFGVTIKHDSVTLGHKLGKQLMMHNSALDRIDSKLVIVSGQKLKTFIITRKKYVTNMSRFKENE